MSLLVGCCVAILTFAASAPLSGFLSFAQAQTMQQFCQPQPPNVLEILTKRLMWGTHAESGDTVRFSAFLASGSAVINYGGQWADDEGVYKRYNHRMAVSSAASPARATIPASAGWYRDAAVSLETANITGQTLYVTHELGRTNGGAFAPIAMLAQGWLTSNAAVGDKNPPPADGGGGGGGGGCCIATQAFVITAGTTSIAASVPVAAGTQVRILTVDVVLVTSATVASRLVELLVTSAAGPFYTVFASTPQPASTTWGYEWIAGGDRNPVPSGFTDYLPLPESYWFSSNITVSIIHSNPQPADDYGSLIVGYETKGP